jgi:hypothetical protein
VLRKLMPPVRTWAGLMSHSLYQMKWRGNALCFRRLTSDMKSLACLPAGSPGWLKPAC